MISLCFKYEVHNIINSKINEIITLRLFLNKHEKLMYTDVYKFLGYWYLKSQN